MLDCRRGRLPTLPHGDLTCSGRNIQGRGSACRSSTSRRKSRDPPSLSLRMPCILLLDSSTSDITGSLGPGSGAPASHSPGSVVLLPSLPDTRTPRLHKGRVRLGLKESRAGTQIASCIGVRIVQMENDTAAPRNASALGASSSLSINFRCGLGGGGRQILNARANRSGLLADVAPVQQPSDKFARTRRYRGRAICRASVQTPRCPASRGKGVRRRSEHLGDQGAQFPARLGPRFFCPPFSLPTICTGARTRTRA
jgi:hypothetical protein